MGNAGIDGQQMLDKYHVQKIKLGQGAFSTVWRAVHRQTGSLVAIKQLTKGRTAHNNLISSREVQREIAMMRAVQHENILALLDVVEDTERIYLAVEYCDGGDFGDKIKEFGSVIDEVGMAEWMRQVCSAIAALHAKTICHRDIKPDNFMVAGSSLKLCDFGLAVFAPKGRLLTERCGTPAFMSPELYKLPEESPGYWLPVDMWAAGIIMYLLMFGGRHPFLDARGHIDVQRMCQGSLDFDPDKGLGLLKLAIPAEPSVSSTSISSSARRLCRAMLETDPRQRLWASDALRDMWLHLGTVGLAAGTSFVAPAIGAGGHTPELASTAYGSTPVSSVSHFSDAPADQLYLPPQRLPSEAACGGAARLSQQAAPLRPMARAPDSPHRSRSVSSAFWPAGPLPSSSPSGPRPIPSPALRARPQDLRPSGVGDADLNPCVFRQDIPREGSICHLFRVMFDGPKERAGAICPGDERRQPWPCECWSPQAAAPRTWAVTLA
eukprot:TRINITY_DN73693_c0_g1_i1.p1 TRINITY_DN73693_c0_g1~~TRINITY_DN73693_c0_g1_i1.p1  ORF type:complete len:520 (-),score=62.82 TRINITY_DN73693_c0_g1_i1:18-1499(-)